MSNVHIFAGIYVKEEYVLIKVKSILNEREPFILTLTVGDSFSV